MTEYPLVFYILFLINFLTCEHIVDGLESLSDIEVAALVTNIAAGYICAVMACRLSLGRGEVTACTTAELDNKGLLSVASGLDSVTEVKEQLEGGSADGNITEADNMALY